MAAGRLQAARSPAGKQEQVCGRSNASLRPWSERIAAGELSPDACASILLDLAALAALALEGSVACRPAKGLVWCMKHLAA